MKSCFDIEDLVVKEYSRQREAGNFTESNWDESRLSIELESPFPKGFILKVEPYRDYYDEENHYDVNIYDRSGNEVASASTEDLRKTHLFYAVYQAALHLTYIPWADYDVEEAWKAFCTIPLDKEDKLPHSFLHFQAGNSKQAVLSWFNEKYSLGLSALMDPAGSGEALFSFRIPVVWEMKDYITVVAKSQSQAMEHIMSGICPMPQGMMIDGSFQIDTREAITSEPIQE